jgi:hypothetical protein
MNEHKKLLLAKGGGLFVRHSGEHARSAFGAREGLTDPCLRIAEEQAVESTSKLRRQTRSLPKLLADASRLHDDLPFSTCSAGAK